MTKLQVARRRGRRRPAAPQLQARRRHQAARQRAPLPAASGGAGGDHRGSARGEPLPVRQRGCLSPRRSPSALASRPIRCCSAPARTSCCTRPSPGSAAPGTESVFPHPSYPRSPPRRRRAPPRPVPVSLLADGINDAEGLLAAVTDRTTTLVVRRPEQCHRRCPARGGPGVARRSSCRSRAAHRRRGLLRVHRRIRSRRARRAGAVRERKAGARDSELLQVLRPGGPATRLRRRLERRIGGRDAGAYRALGG